MRKIIVITLLLIIFASAFYNSFAFEIGTKDLVSLGQCEVYLKQGDGDKHTAYVVYRKDGKNYPAYCIDPDLDGIGMHGVGDYSVNVNSKFTDEKIWRAIINGYPYKSLQELGVACEQEAFTATKFAIYTVMYGYDTTIYRAADSDAGRRTYNAMVQIVNAAKNSTEKIEKDIKIELEPENDKWNIDSINKNCISKTYSIITQMNQGEYDVSIVEGVLPKDSKIVDLNNNEKTKFAINEKFKIIMPITNLLEDGKFKIKIKSNFETKPILYGRTTIPGTQNYALTGTSFEDSTCIYNETYSKNITKINVIKQDGENENRLKGVKFNLLDDNKNILKENLVTDENGEIMLDNMIPGKYYLKEIETLTEYNLYTDLIEINLGLNEEVKAVVNNLPKIITKLDKNIETIEVSSKLEESTYNEVKKESSINKTTKKLPVTGY